MDAANSIFQQQEEPAAATVAADNASRDIRKYKTRSKTDDSVLLASNEFNNENFEKKSNELDNGEVVIMSIQERMAALRKSGEEEWRKRNTASLLLNSEQGDQQQQQQTAPTNSISLIKQQQLQLKQQLQNVSGKAMPKYLNNELKRAILAPLNDNSNNIDNEDKSIESIESIEQPQVVTSEKREKKLPAGGRIIFNPSDLNADLEKALLKNKVKKNGSENSKQTIPSSSSFQQLNERVELFSTDSEMDSFFKENESKTYKYNDLFSSSSAASPNKTDNDDLENDDEFDRIVSEAQR